MKKKTLFIAFSNQKGGVGKSAFTVLAASYLHYVKGKNVAVVDCDYPQFSILGMRDRDLDSIKNDEAYQAMLIKQFDNIQKKIYPIEKATPEEAISIAQKKFLETDQMYDVILFDLSGTVNSLGILNSIMNMDYIFVPIVTDKMVMQSSLSFAVGVANYQRTNSEIKLKGIYHFWNKVDKRENKEVYDTYNGVMQRLNLNTLKTSIPNALKYKKELSLENRLVFRSTIFPPDRKLLKGSNLDKLLDEICEIINLK